MSGVNFPLTLNSGQSASLEIEFDPTTVGLANGEVTLTSNSSTGVTAQILLSGGGVPPQTYEVLLSWDAPVGSSDPVAGYNIYREISGSGSYLLLNSTVNTPTTYTDGGVTPGDSYTYYVESVDSEGNQSSPSTTISVTVPQ